MTDTLLPDLQPLARALANHDPGAFLRAVREIQADAYERGAADHAVGRSHRNPYR